MIERHTTGRLHVQAGGQDVDIAAGPQRCLAYVSVAGARGLTLAEAQANAKRLVACWNHCEGFDTETVSAGPNMRELVAEAALARDTALELLAALREIAELEGDCEQQVFRLTRFQAAQISRAAILKAEGGPT